MPVATPWHMLILVFDLVVQEGHDETRCRACGPALLPLIEPCRVIRVQGPLAILIDAAQDGVDVVGKQALRVEDGAQPLGTRLDRHGLAVLVAVHLDDVVEAFFQGIAVGGVSYHGEDDAAGLVVGADAEELGGVPGVDGVARDGAGVAGEDGEVGAGYAESGATVIGVAAD